MDEYNKIWVSVLDEAFVPLNQLSAIENALIIYRLSRAPDRRVFYVDVGELPKSKAEAYIKELIKNYRNDMKLDPETGSVVETGRKMSLTDDIWLPRSNGKGTEVSTLPGLSNLGEITDIEYFRDKLFRALNVPFSRFTNPSGSWVNRAPEITRDEVLFAKFLSRLRTQYNELFFILLRSILNDKRIVDSKEMDAEYLDITFNWSTDNIFNELKNLDVLAERLNSVERAAPHLGKLFSISWMRKNILQQTDEEIRDMDKEIEDERKLMAKWDGQDDEPLNPGVFEPVPGSDKDLPEQPEPVSGPEGSETSTSSSTSITLG
jgi:hypothetical protein